MNTPLPPFPHPTRPLLTPSQQGTRGLAWGLPTPSRGEPGGSPTPFRSPIRRQPLPNPPLGESARRRVTADAGILHRQRRCLAGLPRIHPVPPSPHPAFPLPTPLPGGFPRAYLGVAHPFQGGPLGLFPPFPRGAGGPPYPFPRFIRPGSRPSSPASISKALQPRFLRVASPDSIHPVRCRQLFHFQRRRAPVPILPVAPLPGPPHRESARRTATADVGISDRQPGDLTGLPGNHPAAPSPNTPARRTSPPPFTQTLPWQLQPRHSAFLSTPASPRNSPERPADSSESEANPHVLQRTNTPDAPEVQTQDRAQKSQTAEYQP
jgi:hypothetical protein